MRARLDPFDRRKETYNMQTHYPAFHAEYWVYALAAFVIIVLGTLLFTVDGPIKFRWYATAAIISAKPIRTTASNIKANRLPLFRAWKKLTSSATTVSILSVEPSNDQPFSSVRR
jgi:hypothetical protein